jgi:hypothetical protein
MALRLSHKICAILTAISATVALVLASHIVAAKDSGDDDRDDDGSHAYTIALFGDMPYNAIGKAQYPALLTDINRAHVAFSVHDGDLKAGGDGPCSDSLYTTALAYFDSLEQPLIFTTGDNDWTDCWGRYGLGTQPYSDPLERLNFERVLFFSTDRSLGKHTLKLTRQTAEGYPENSRWKRGPVVYITLNVQGSNDNYPYHDTDAEGGPTIPVRSDAEITRQRNEEIARKAADLRWLSEGFDYAEQVHAKGVMILQQSDLNFNNEQHLTNPHDYDALTDYQAALRAHAEAFNGQVALIHGDSHYFKLDKPLNRSTGDGVLTNFTRVETFGARNSHWVRATIDASDPNVFRFEQKIVAANTQ